MGWRKEKNDAHQYCYERVHRRSLASQLKCGLRLHSCHQGWHTQPSLSPSTRCAGATPPQCHPPDGVVFVCIYRFQRLKSLKLGNSFLSIVSFSNLFVDLGEQGSLPSLSARLVSLTHVWATLCLRDAVNAASSSHRICHQDTCEGPCPGDRLAYKCHIVAYIFASSVSNHGDYAHS